MKIDRISPDWNRTHWMLFFKPLMRMLCDNKLAWFGKNAEVRPYSYLIWCSHIAIGNNVIIRPNTMLFADEHSYIDIRDDVSIGSGVHIYTNDYDYNNTDKPIGKSNVISEDVLIHNNSWIGANAIILKGVTIGEHSVIGAGSVVTKDIPPFSVAVGNPCRVIKTITDTMREYR